MKKFLIIGIILLLGNPGFSQTVLMKKEVNDTLLGKYGQNLRNYWHFYTGIGFIVGKPDSTGSDINGGNSRTFSFGVRYKWRLCNLYALGFDIAYNSSTYSLLQSSEKVTPDTVYHDKEKLRFGNAGAVVYMRFNYGRRGNRIGRFVDLGAYGDWTFRAVHITKDKLYNGNIRKVALSHLDYYNTTNYGATARIGFNRYVFYGTYRLSDIFKKDFKYPELPRIVVGLQIGLHK